MKIAVVGAESSGTRLMTRIMQNAGAETLHRSFPYGGDGPTDPRRWPEEDVRQFNPYAVIWMNRDWWATAQSQVKALHVSTPEEAWYNISRTTIRIADLCKNYNFKHYMVNYESLVQRPQAVVRNITNTLGLPFPEIENIIDGNAKYLEN